MCYRDAWITYNGEIYNYVELREELEQKGHRFLTRSDTEVVLAAWREWGEACLHRFNGMWAFAIADLQTKTLFLARDRFGVKPLYYHQGEGKLLFASEHKTLLGAGLLRPEIRPEAVFDFFVLGELEHEPEGFFQGITELPAGFKASASLSDLKLKPEQWYRLPYKEDRFTDNEPDIEHISSLLENAVRLRLRADVEVGSCLSGGLDSSVLVAHMNRLLKGKAFHTFTAVFKGKSVDESHWAALAADGTSAKTHEIEPSATELLKDLNDLMYAQDIPIWSTSTYAQFRVMKKVAEEGIKVVLDGQGGDEVFAGYAPHRYFLLKGLSPFGRIKTILQSNMPGLLPFYIRQWLRFDAINKLPKAWIPGFYLRYFGDLKYLNRDFFNRYAHRIAAKAANEKDLNGRLAREIQNTSLKTYLRCEDRCAMWHSVESRTPFADDVDLIEYVFSLSGRNKIHDMQLKSLLREASKGICNNKITNRQDKQGYTTPNSEWIQAIAPKIKSIIEAMPGEFINTEKLMRDYTQFFVKQKNINENRLFKFISFAVWYQVFIANQKNN
jgi:asparagine synthase (glutamine-hydrolysing)